MATEFTRLSDVPMTEGVQTEDTVLVVQDGEVKRAPKAAVGGNGGWDAVIDLGADNISGGNGCAFWNGDYDNAVLIRGDYDIILSKLKAGDFPKILLKGILAYYGTLYTFTSQATYLSSYLDGDEYLIIGYTAYYDGQTATRWIELSPDNTFTANGV